MMSQDTLFPLVLGIAAKATLLLALAAAFAAALRHRSAATRHAVWTVAVVAVLALPALEAGAPKLAVPVPEALARVATALPTESRATMPDDGPSELARRAGATLESVPSAAPEAASPALATIVDRAVVAIAQGSDLGSATDPVPTLTDAPTPATAFGSRRLALIVWLAGGGLVLALLGWERVLLNGIARRATPARGRLARRAEEIARERATSARLLVSERVRMPMTWGIVRPVVLIPAEHDGWSEQRLAIVLRHELAHVRRRDHLAQLLGTVMLALHWFNPLAWLAVQRLRVEREHACDDEVLGDGTKPSAYAGELLSLARITQRKPRPALSALAIARPSQLSQRLLAVLEENRPRGPLTRRVFALVATAGIVLALPLAGIAPTTGPAAAEAAVTAVPRAPASGILAPQAASECWAPHVNGSRRVITSDDEGYLLIEWESARCDADVTLTGELRFSEDFSSIVGVSDGGHFRFRLREGGTERSLEVRSDPDGSSSFVWRVDRDVREYDASARAWMASILPQMLRQTGLAAEERGAWIYSRHGADGVFDEVELIDSNSVSRRYLTVLVRQPGVGQGDLARVLQVARAKISSNSSLRTLLTDFAATHEGVAGASELAREYWLAVDAIDSNSTLRALLLAITEGAPADSPIVQGALGRARTGISSNSTMAAFLREIDRRYPELLASGPGHERFWEALARIDSNSTLARLLLDLAADEPAGSPALDRVLGRAREGITSNSQMGSFLIQFAEAHPDAASGRLRQSVLDMARSISSRSTRERTLRRLGASG